MKLKFIVIDDVKGIRDIFYEYLTGLGHEVFCAEHPLATSVCKKTQCTNEIACADGYFIDFSMPYMTGLELLENTVRRGCKIPSQNKVLMSGYLTQEVRDKANELGITVVHKPVTLSKIGELVEEISCRVDSKRRLADLPSS